MEASEGYLRSRVLKLTFPRIETKLGFSRSFLVRRATADDDPDNNVRRDREMQEANCWIDLPTLMSRRKSIAAAGQIRDGTLSTAYAMLR